MKSPKNLALLLLAVTTIGGAVLAWNQYQELVELRAGALNKDERASLQKRIWDLERYNKELSDELAALRDGSDGMGDPVAGGPGGRGNGGGGPGGRGNFRGGRGNNNNNPQQMANALRTLMSKPEVQALMSVQQKAAIDARYASLFRSMNLSPEQADKVKTLLADRQTTMQDVQNAARENGVRDPAEIRKLMAAAQADINTSLKAALGDGGFNQLQNYEQTLPQRNLVNQLQQRLSYTDTPLSQAQADQLVQVLAANPAAQRTNADGTPAPAGRGGRGGGGGAAGGGGGFGGGGGGGGGFGGGGDIGGAIAALGGGGGPGGIGAILGGGGGGGGGGPTVTVTPAAVTQAQSVLAGPQLAALQQIQQQQQTQQQLAQIVRNTIETQAPAAGGNNRGGANTGTTTGGAATGGGGGGNRRKGGG